MMREVAVPETGNFRGVCPISNRAKEYLSYRLWAFPALIGTGMQRGAFMQSRNIFMFRFLKWVSVKHPEQY
jgi:hypothetical protein